MCVGREVTVVAQRVGRAELSEDAWGPHCSEIEVSSALGLRSVQRFRLGAPAAEVSLAEHDKYERNHG